MRERKNSLRKPGHCYSDPGLYFMTILTRDREPWLGSVRGGWFIPSPIGYIVRRFWTTLPGMYTTCSLDAWTMMPEHIHAILALHPDPLDKDLPIKPLGRLLGAFKTVCAKEVNRRQGWEGSILWQRSFHDRIVQDENALRNMRSYIHRHPRPDWLRCHSEYGGRENDGDSLPPLRERPAHPYGSRPSQACRHRRITCGGSHRWYTHATGRENGRPS